MWRRGKKESFLPEKTPLNLAGRGGRLLRKGLKEERAMEYTTQKSKGGEERK